MTVLCPLLHLDHSLSTSLPQPFSVHFSVTTVLCSQVHLSVTAHATGELHVTGVVFNLGTSLAVVQPPVTSGSVLTSAVGSSLGGMTVRGKLVLDVQGPRLADTKEERNSKVYGPDCRLDIIVAPPMPQLQVD